MTIKERYHSVLDIFSRTMPSAESELTWGNEFQLLVAVMLSAQCTDRRVNMVTPPLFSAYPDALSMSNATADDIFHYIRSVSYPNSKAAHIVSMCKKLVTDYDGEVPRSREALESLPGVGRKTANVMLAVAFGEAAMPVDTHVFRVSERIGLTTGSKTPRQTEDTLCKHIPASIQGKAHHWLLLHGRYVCTARNPKCGTCALSAVCRHYEKQIKAR
ncbi:MAG: endonuclease III [Paludibacteraceae bacterium]|nr:endonuclease III [Paludibacteraceae bacterium]